jgi:hypothetical protein
MGDVKHAVEIDVEYAPPVLNRVLGVDALANDDAGIIDQDRNVAGTRFDGLCKLSAGIDVRDVEMVMPRSPPCGRNIVGRPRNTVAVDVGDNDIGAMCSQTQRNRTTVASGSTRYKRQLTLQQIGCEAGHHAAFTGVPARWRPAI